MCVCIVGLLFMCLIGGNETSEEAQDTIARLDKLTSVSCHDDIYLFEYKDKWVVNYNKNAQTVKINEKKIYDCISEGFEIDDIGNDGNFIYNWEKNQLYAGVDCEDKDGHITFIMYSLDKKEWTLMLNDEWYDFSDEFKKYVDDYGLLDAMQQDVKAFENDLAVEDLSIEDLKNLDYDDIVQYYEEHPIKNEPESENETEKTTEQEQEESQAESGDQASKDIQEEQTDQSNAALDYETPFEQIVTFYQNNDKDASGEMQLVDCYQDYDEIGEQSIIVVNVHVKNTGNTDISVSSADFSMYGDNSLLEKNYTSNYNLILGTISPGREIEGTVVFSADPLQYDVVELEFAGVTIPVRNDKVNVFQDRPEEDFQ